MKKLFLAIVFIFIATSSYAVDGKFSFSILGNSSYKAHNGETAKFIGEVEIGNKFKFVRPYVNIKTMMDDFDENTFSPADITYDIGFITTLKSGLYIKLNHVCIHAIDKEAPYEDYNKLEIGYEFK